MQRKLHMQPFAVGERVRSKGLGWQKYYQDILGTVTKVNTGSVHVLFDGYFAAFECERPYEDIVRLHRTAKKSRDAARAAAHATVATGMCDDDGVGPGSLKPHTSSHASRPGEPEGHGEPHLRGDMALAMTALRENAVDCAHVELFALLRNFGTNMSRPSGMHGR